MSRTGACPAAGCFALGAMFVHEAAKVREGLLEHGLVQGEALEGDDDAEAMRNRFRDVAVGGGVLCVQDDRSESAAEGDFAAAVMEEGEAEQGLAVPVLEAGAAVERLVERLQIFGEAEEFVAVEHSLDFKTVVAGEQAEHGVEGGVADVVTQWSVNRSMSGIVDSRIGFFLYANGVISQSPRSRAW